MRFTLIPFLISLILLTGCSSDPYESYVGHWEKQNTNHQNVMIISKDGDTILMNDQVLNLKKAEKDKKFYSLKKSEGQLTLNGAVFSLSENKNILMAGNNSYKRISTDYVEQLKEKITQKEIAGEKIKIACNELIKKFNVEKEALGFSMRDNLSSDNSEKKQKKNEILDRYKVLAKKIDSELCGNRWLYI